MKTLSLFFILLTSMLAWACPTPRFFGYSSCNPSRAILYYNSGDRFFSVIAPDGRQACLTFEAVSDIPPCGDPPYLWRFNLDASSAIPEAYSTNQVISVCFTNLGYHAAQISVNCACIATVSFPVFLITPQAAMDALIGDVERLGAGVGHISLRRAILSAAARLEAGDNQGAIRWLEQFKSRLAKKVADADGRDRMIFYTDNLIDALKCP